MRQWRLRTVAIATTVAAVSVLGFSGTAHGAAAGPDQGVTSNSVKIGFVTSNTGVASSSSGTSDIGCKARIARQNKAGGVNGRKLDVVYVDDGSSGANLTQTQDLVQNKHVYMIVNDSAFVFLTWRWLLDHNVPNVLGGYDGTEYGQPGNEALISGFGNTAPVVGVTYDTTMKVAKSLGGTKVAALGYGISPSSSAAAKATSAYAAPAAGLKSVYTNTSVEFGSTEVSPLVLGIKNSGADVGYYAMDANTNLAIASGLAQNGVKMKAQLMATGYGQQLLDQPLAKTIGTDVIFGTPGAPIELKSAATKQFVSDLKKYQSFTGVPDFGIYTGYQDCDLAIAALNAQGKTPDASGAAFASTVRSKLPTYNPGGLSCAPLNFSTETYGKPAPTQCGWEMQIKNDKFVILKPPGGKTTYWSGSLIGASVSTTSSS